MEEDKNNEAYYQYEDVSLRTQEPFVLGNIDLSAITMSTVSIGPIDHVGAQGSTYIPNDISVTGSTYSWAPYGAKGLNLDHDSDIKLGDLSLKDWMEQVNNRLGILIPNPRLEQEFEQLRALGEQYKALEKELTQGLEVWNTLKHNDGSLKKK